jgi:hypothetical protein
VFLIGGAPQVDPDPFVGRLGFIAAPDGLGAFFAHPACHVGLLLLDRFVRLSCRARNNGVTATMLVRRGGLWMLLSHIP